MSAADLPTSQSPDISPAAVLRFLDALEAAPGVDPHSLMILRHGRVAVEGWWAPYARDHRTLMYSLTKSFTSTAAAFAVAEGLLRLDDPVVSYFPEFEAEITDPGSRSILVRHLLSMASGHSGEQWGEATTRDPDEPVRGFLLGGPDREPGSVFAYNQPCTYTVGAIIQRASGQRLLDYLRPRLFDPLGIGDLAWRMRPTGRDLGHTGLHATTEAVAKLGQLYLQRGVWNGERLLSEEWVEQATSLQTDNSGRGEGPDWEQGYGYQFWISRHGFRGDGAYGQYCLVLPEQDAVVVLTSETVDMQALLGLVWEHLLPGFASDEGDPGELEKRLAGLALEPCPGGAAAGGGGFVCVAQDGPVAEIRGSQCPDGSGDWLLTLTERAAEDVVGIEYGGFPRGPITLRLAPGCGWRTSAPGKLPTAVSGGWTDPATLRFDVLFLETPHRMFVTCGLAPGSESGTVEARFVSDWLASAPLSTRRAPLPSAAAG
ncbi:MAG TPA: serine hydrolase domain-containing protein [Actinospica sp.]|nr:serine hydrolase domain-containing protein [Actinospica sp.]